MRLHVCANTTSYNETARKDKVDGGGGGRGGGGGAFYLLGIQALSNFVV